ncbi:MAG: DUF494 domain-containing protein [Chromatiales bacterium]|nr:DUF494 domain-containing protein [Chromatiales bacterium]
MKETVFDVLVYLFENYMDGESEPADADTLRDELMQVGFPEAEIEKAFDWLDALADGRHEGADPVPGQVHPMRYYLPREMDRMDVECRGFLLFLEQSGILDVNSREVVIDRFLALEAEDAGLEHLKWVVLMVLFNQPGSEAAYAWMEDLVYEQQPAYLH